jgi:hypothetical protein
MTTTVQSLVLRAHDALQDSDGVRWPATELVRYLNDGQRVLCVVRPDASAASVPFVPVAGARQTIPASAISLMDVTRNTGGRVIRKVDHFSLDCANRDWQSATGVSIFSNFTYDPREPRVFYLYPPAIGGAGSVDVVYSTYPADVPTPSGALYTTCTGNISVVDQWDTALLDYVLGRAYSKDAEFGGNKMLADSYMTAFVGLIGGQLQSSQTVAPKQ